MKKIKLNFRNIETIEVDEGTTLFEVSKMFKNYFNSRIMCANFDNELVSLDTEVLKKGNVDFYDLSSTYGNTVYSHSVHFLMVVAVKKVLGNDTDVIIEHSIDNGVYCRIINGKANKDTIEKISNKMRELVEQDLRFTHLSVKRMDAIRFFKQNKEYDKMEVLKYVSNNYVDLYRLDEYYDFFFSNMCYSTKALKDFKLTYVKDNGFVLGVPTIDNPDTTFDYKHVPIIFDKFEEYGKWCSKVGINNASDLNGYVIEGKYNQVIRLAEINYENQLMDIASDIFSNRNKIKLVLLAGPSSSGKTTSAKKLCLYLQSKGLKTHVLSTDDYFKEREDTPKDINGEYDFECLNAIDLNLFNKHLSKLLSNEKVNIPSFNFKTGKKEYKDNWLQIEDNDIVVIEGLHCLNEDLTQSIPRKNKYKIFICPFTQINIDNHNRIHTSDARRLRRMVRDNKHRGYNASSTLSMWHKIREGEQKYIFPFQNDSDACINSALLYEIGVLKVYAEPLLYAVSPEDPMYPEALRLINFLKNFLPIPSDDVPKDSFLREFIGGSGFEQ